MRLKLKLSKNYIIGGAIVALVGLGAVILLLFNGPRMENQPNFRTYEFKKMLPPEDAVAFNQDEFNIEELALPEVNDENLKTGKVYYNYYCVHCHGIDGRGNGPVGKSYIPKPADLTQSNFFFIEDEYKAMLTGTGHSPVLERIVDKDHINHLLLFVRYGFNN